MGVAKIMAMQEYTHAYRMWKRIATNDCTWVRFKAQFQEFYPDIEELKKRPEWQAIEVPIMSSMEECRMTS